MANSKIKICNFALAHLGADAIRSFDESNKRARLSDVFYESLRDFMLHKYDWGFSRKFIKLQQLVVDSDTIPYGEYAYQLPNDCLVPRDLWPLGSRTKWEVFGLALYCELESVGLYYTSKNTDAAQFSEPFSQILAMALAVRMCMPITHDVKMTQELFRQYKLLEPEMWALDANAGNVYRAYDEDPNKDTFVDPDAAWTDPVFQA